MSAKHNPSKVTLGTTKGKPFATSVPIIHYHANDEEIEELYPSTDDEEHLTSESEKPTPKFPPSPSRSLAAQKSGEEDAVSTADKRFVNLDSNSSEGTPPPSDPWKVFSEIKGKIAKTFEEKLSEIKSDKRKKRGLHKDNSSLSDSEDLEDATPTDDTWSDKQQKEQGTGVARRRGNPARYMSFSQVKTGWKDKNSQEECVESGIEAAEFSEDITEASELGSESNAHAASISHRGTDTTNTDEGPPQQHAFETCEGKLSREMKLKTLFVQLKQELKEQLTYRLLLFGAMALCLYYFAPLPDHLLGLVLGVVATVGVHNAIAKTKEILTSVPEETVIAKQTIPVLEVPAAEEHAVVERYEGWLNQLPYAYDPDNYHVARTKSVFIRLEGSVMRIMETRIKVPKRAIWDEPKHKLKFTRRKIYDLTGARVDLLPEGLIRRRRWSKKYPIRVKLSNGALIRDTILKEPSENGHFPSENEEAADETSERGRSSKKYERSMEEDTESGGGEDVEKGNEEEVKKVVKREDDVGERKEGRVEEEKDEVEEGEEEEEEEEEERQQQQHHHHHQADMERGEVNGESRQAREEEGTTAWHAKDPRSTSEERQEDDDEDALQELYFFARADRQKEDWYRRFVSATSSDGKSQPSRDGCTISRLSSTSTQQSFVDSKGSISQANPLEAGSELGYNAYMAKFLDVYSSIAPEYEDAVSQDNANWFNCLSARVLFDMHKCPETISLLQDRIQRKLSNIKLPYFMEGLSVSEVAIGQGAPVIHKIAKPVTNGRGLWFELDVSYKGCLTMTVETKLNLMKLTRTGSLAGNVNTDILNAEKPNKSPMFDSDVEDTPETSTEEEDTSNASVCNAKELGAAPSSGKKFLSMVDKLTANKYFQHATELSYVRRAMEGVSNTEIRLTVTVSGIEGSLAVNIPPPPSDRLWYGFQPVPKISLTVKPAVGERTVNIVYVTKWIEAKLLREFEKVVVLPNMDDLVLPLCPNYPCEAP